MAERTSSEGRICLINPYPPSVSPRLVRNAEALSEAGYDVVVVSTRFAKRLLPHDQDPPGRRWHLRVVDLTESSMGRLRWQLVRLRRRVCVGIANRFPSSPLVRRACCYAGPELASLAARQKAALYLAHTHGALPSAAEAASRTGAKLAFDAEDLLAESSAEPTRVMQAIEHAYVPRCCLVTTMSRAAARRLQTTLNLAEAPLVLHNTPSLKERAGLCPPEARKCTNPISIYWFGQTLGPHSCADQVLRAIPLLARPTKLVLRGRPVPSYVGELQSLAAELGISNRLEVCPRAPPAEMVRLAGQHDILLGSQPSSEPFHQMAVGNKVFTGMMAGLALMLTDTVAHRDLLQDLEESAVLFGNKNPGALARQLNAIAASDARLLDAKRLAWRLGETRFNWEVESQPLLAKIRDLIGLPAVHSD